MGYFLVGCLIVIVTSFVFCKISFPSRSYLSGFCIEIIATSYLQKKNEMIKNNFDLMIKVFKKNILIEITPHLIQQIFSYKFTSKKDIECTGYGIPIRCHDRNYSQYSLVGLTLHLGHTKDGELIPC